MNEQEKRDMDEIRAQLEKITDEDVYRYYGVESDAMHTAVGIDQGSAGEDAKHLRAGINLEMVSNAAMISLLMRKGMITNREYLIELAIQMRLEVVRYEKLLNEKLGTHISLG